MITIFINTSKNNLHLHNTQFKDMHSLIEIKKHNFIANGIQNKTVKMGQYFKDKMGQYFKDKM
jgi:hypothetical protein